MVVFSLAMSSRRMYYFKWSTYSLCGLDCLCAGWCVDYVLGRVVFFWVFVEVWCGCLYSCEHYLVLFCYIVYVHYVLALLFISLCRDAFAYGSAILTFVIPFHYHYLEDSNQEITRRSRHGDQKSRKLIIQYIIIR